jgi:hypothetical protein
VASRLLLVVQLSSERTLEPVRKDCSFAEKQQPQAARLLVVRLSSEWARQRLRQDCSSAKEVGVSACALGSSSIPVRPALELPDARGQTEWAVSNPGETRVERGLA